MFELLRHPTPRLQPHREGEMTGAGPVSIRVSEREMHRVDVFLARFQGPEVDACRPSGPAASSNRGCRIQLLATRRDQTLEHGAGKYRIQVTNNVCVSKQWLSSTLEALLASEKFLPFRVICD